MENKKPEDIKICIINCELPNSFLIRIYFEMVTPLQIQLTKLHASC